MIGRQSTLRWYRRRVLSRQGRFGLFPNRRHRGDRQKHPQLSTRCIAFNLHPHRKLELDDLIAA